MNEIVTALVCKDPLSLRLPGRRISSHGHRDAWCSHPIALAVRRMWTLPRPCQRPGLLLLLKLRLFLSSVSSDELSSLSCVPQKYRPGARQRRGQNHGCPRKWRLQSGGRKGLPGNLGGTLGHCGKKSKGDLDVLVTGWGRVTRLLVAGGGVSVKIWQSVGPALSCAPPEGTAKPSAPAERKMQSASSLKAKAEESGPSAGEGEKWGERSPDTREDVWEQ